MMTLPEIDFARVDSVSEDDRANPSASLIDAMRRAFPTEREYDRMLTRKMRLRASGSHPQIALGTLEQSLRDMLADLGFTEVGIDNLRWFAGGASKIQAGLTVTARAADGTAVSHKLVLRMEPRESLNATSRDREAQVIAAVSGAIPVPTVRWLDAEARWFPQPTLVYDLAQGVAKPTQDSIKVAGIGIAFPEELRRKLAPQFVDTLARIHTVALREADLPAYQFPPTGTADSAIWQVNRVRRVWEEDRCEEFPLVEVAANWLGRTAPLLDRPVLVHGDYRSGNFLFDEQTAAITAVLDWERSCIGDRHRDLAWTCCPTFGTRTGPGGDLMVCGLIARSEFLDRYQSASGLAIDPAKLHWWEVFNAWQAVVTAIGSSHRVVRHGKTHQDILLTWLDGAGYAMADDLTRLLGEVL